MYLPYEPRLVRYWRARGGLSEMPSLHYGRDFPVERPYFLSRRMRRAYLRLTAAVLDRMLDKSEARARELFEAAGISQSAG